MLKFKAIKKILKITGFTLLVLLIFAMAVRALVVMPVFQTWLVQRVTLYLSDELHTRVSIKHVDIEFFRKIVLKDIYVEDQQGDTLLYAPLFKVAISRFNYEKQRLTINEAELVNARIELIRYKNIKGLSFQFFADYFSSSKKDTALSPPWEVKLKNILLKNTTFSYRDLRWNDATRCIDWEDVYVTNLNADLRDLRFENDTILFHAQEISLKEKSGFQLNHFTADVRFAENYFDFNNFTIQTPQSDLKGQISFDFDSWEDFDDYIHKVRMRSSFAQSVLASEDIKYFATEVIGLHKTLKFSGDIKGTVDRLKGKNMQIVYTPRSLFKGDIILNGLPDIEESYIELNINELRLNKKDIETIPAFPFESGGKIALPANLEYLGTVKFKGKFSGFYNDFVAYGNATTDLGFISSDLNLKIGDGKSPAHYSGHLSTFNFDIGKLLRLQPDIGFITARVEVKGSGLSVDRINTKLEGNINDFQVKGYTYHNMTVKGEMAKKLFNGSLTVRDENADFDFNGTVNYQGKLPVFDFVADVHLANLAKLHLVNRDSSSSLSTYAELHCTGNKIDNLEGSLNFINTNYKEYPRGITLNNLTINSTEVKNKKQINLESDFANASMTGMFKLSEIFQSAAYILSQYIPAIKVKNIASLDDQTFDYRIDLKETRGVLDVLLPELSVQAGTHVEGHFNTLNNDFTASLQSDEVSYQALRFSGINITGNTSQGQLIVSAKEDVIQINDSLLLRNVLLTGKANSDSAYLNLLISNTDTSLSRFNAGFVFHFADNGVTTIKIDPADILIRHDIWQLDPANFLLLDSSGIAISNYNFHSGNQSINIDGKVSRNVNDKLTFAFSQFNIIVLNDLLKTYNVQLGGTMNGSADISSIYHKPSINGNLNVDHLSFYNDTLGNANIISDWNTGQGIINITAIVTRGGEQNITVDGKYIIKEKNDEIDFTISLKKTNIKTFSNYLDGIVSDLSGIASGEFRLHGLASKPLLTGDAHFQKVNFRIDYLNTHYSLSTDVKLKEEYIEFNHVIVNDAKGNKAIANGKVYHKNLRNFYFDVDIAAGKTQVLNTSMHDNELFYGEAYASGRVNITGYLDYIKMDIGLKSEKGTEISIPLSNPSEVSHNSFITFVKSEELKDSILKAQTIDISGIEVNFDLEVTPDAIIRLEFDPKIGDVIKGTGHGNIIMNISPAEGYKMYGDYIIESGSYLFTLQNVLSKDFAMEKGGYIRWSGDPYDAYININAHYKNLNAGLYDLLQDSTIGYSKAVPVVLTLNISDKLFNPVIKFDIAVKNVDATTESRVKRAINTEEAKYKQAVSLLVIRRFSPADELSNRAQLTTGDVVGANAYEFLSAQLSNWASQINENVNVGLNYNPGSSLTQEEWEVALGTSLFNDRVIVQGNVGVANSNSTTATNQNTSSLVGDFNVEVKANKDGRVRLKAFGRTNNNTLISTLNSEYTGGIGVFYREEFNTFGELMERFKNKFRKKKPTEESTGNLN